MSVGTSTRVPTVRPVLHSALLNTYSQPHNLAAASQAITMLGTPTVAEVDEVEELPNKEEGNGHGVGDDTDATHQLLRRLVGAQEAALRDRALIELCDLVLNTYGPSAEQLADQIRSSGAIPVMTACLGESTREKTQQRAMECLGTLLATTFDSQASLTLRIFAAAGGLAMVQALCDVPDARAPGENVLFAAAMLQNITAADDDEQTACSSLREAGCERVLERLVEAAAEALPRTDAAALTIPASPSPQLLEYAAGALSNLRTRNPDPMTMQRSGSSSAAVEEALRQRRLCHMIDEMRKRRGVNTVQRYALRWLEAKRKATAERQALAGSEAVENSESTQAAASPESLVAAERAAELERLRLRRIRHVVDAMRKRRAVHTIQREARAWLEAKRQAIALRAAAWKEADEEAREAAEIAELEASLVAEAEAARTAAEAEALATAARVEELKLAELEAARQARIWASLEAMMNKNAEFKVHNFLRRWVQRWRARRAQEEMAAAKAAAEAAEEASDLLSAVGLEEFRLGRLARLSHELTQGPGGDGAPLSWASAIAKSGGAPRHDRQLIHLRPLPDEIFSYSACEAAAARAVHEQELCSDDLHTRTDSPPPKLRVRHSALSRDRIRLSRDSKELLRSASSDEDMLEQGWPASPTSPASSRTTTSRGRQRFMSIPSATGHDPQRARDDGSSRDGSRDRLATTAGGGLAPPASASASRSSGSVGVPSMQSDVGGQSADAMDGTSSSSLLASTAPSTRGVPRTRPHGKGGGAPSGTSPPQSPRRSSRKSDSSSPSSRQGGAVFHTRQTRPPVSANGGVSSSKRSPALPPSPDPPGSPTCVEVWRRLRPPGNVPHFPPVTGTKMSILKHELKKCMTPPTTGAPPPPSTLLGSEPSELSGWDTFAPSSPSSPSSPAPPASPSSPAPPREGQLGATSPRAIRQKRKTEARAVKALTTAAKAVEALVRESELRSTETGGSPGGTSLGESRETRRGRAERRSPPRQVDPAAARTAVSAAARGNLTDADDDGSAAAHHEIDAALKNMEKILKRATRLHAVPRKF